MRSVLASNGDRWRFDVFLSHASQDKDRFVRQLYEALRRDLEVWYDEVEIELGDDFRLRMEDGLRKSRFGVVVLSPHFLKYWTGQELSFFQTLEAVSGDKRILPVILDMAWEDLVEQLPFMATRRCALAANGVAQVASEIRTAIRSEAERRRSSPGERYKNLRRQRRAAERKGEDVCALTEEIKRLKRQLREGPQLVPGDCLDERFELVERIGSGGFATVWEAYEEAQDRYVAIKVLHGQHTSSDERVERFFRGSRLMQRLAHAHVVRVLEPRGEDAGYRYFVMELLNGGDLWRAISGGRIARDALLGCIEKVAEAVAYAHQRQIIHRDIKPANILLTRDRVPKLTDFDLVQAADTTGGTRTGALGTFVYAAPEAIKNAKNAEPASDVYGLAMTAVVGLLGRVPDFVEKFQPHMLVDQLQDVPRAVAALLGTSLNLDPKKRPRDAAAFLERLRAARAAATAKPARPPATSEPARRPVTSEPPSRLATASHGFNTRQKRERSHSTAAAPFLWRENEDEIGRYAEVLSGTQAMFRMRLIPAGSFLMGSPENEEGRFVDEGPRHRVTLTSGFWMADAPCTQALYEAVVGTNPSRFIGPDRPVERVSWKDAQAFLAKLNERVPGIPFSLPTEAQWEYACRAGTTSARYGGDLDTIAWYSANAWRETHPVRKKLPNAWGLYDVLGNVREWCQDRYSNYRDKDALERAGSAVGSERVLRGGSWNFNARFVRAACRVACAPSYAHVDIGFRLSRGQAAPSKGLEG